MNNNENLNNGQLRVMATSLGENQKKRKGSGGLIDFFFANMLKILTGVATVILAAAWMSDTNLDGQIGKSTETAAFGAKKYKANYYLAENTYKDISPLKSRSFMRPLIYDSTGAYLYPKGEKNIKFYILSHGPATDTTQYAAICLDATAKGWDTDKNEDAENKFASKIDYAFKGSNYIIDGTRASLYADAATAEAATSTDPDSDGFICATQLD